MSNSYDLIVIGGGIVGASASLFAARKGLDVALFERNTIGANASTAAAGILSHPDFLAPDESLTPTNSQSFLGKCGYEYYPEFLEVLNEYETGDVEYRQCGTFYLGFDEDERDQLKNYMDEMQKYDRPCEWAEPSEIQDQYPFVSNEITGGYFYEDIAQIRPDELMHAIETALQLETVELYEDTRVHSVDYDGNRFKSISTDHFGFKADNYLIATGAWSAQFTDLFNLEIPVEPRKGQMCRVKWDRITGGPIFRHDDRFLLPRTNDDVVIGSTVETSGFDTSVTVDGIQDLLSSGLRITEALKDATLESTWAGIRPYAARKGGPFLGKIPEASNVYIAAGHYKTGILQGPYSGKLIAELINDEQPEISLDPFSLDR